MSNKTRGGFLKVGGLAAVALSVAISGWAAPPNKVKFAGDFIGDFVGDCGTFYVLNDVAFEGFFIEHFDKNGNLVFISQHFDFGNSIYYRSDDPTVFLVGIPGEVANERYIVTGNTPRVIIAGLPYQVTVPGHGVVFHQVGRIILDLETGEVLFQAGPNDFVGQDVAALCAALAR